MPATLVGCHFPLAADLSSYICLTRYEPEVYSRSISMSPLTLRVTFALGSTSSLPRIVECPGTQWFSVLIPWARRVCALPLIRLASRCPELGSGCAVQQMAAYESLKTTAIFTPYLGSVSVFSIVTSSANLITLTLAPMTCIPLVPR